MFKTLALQYSPANHLLRYNHPLVIDSTGIYPQFAQCHDTCAVLSSWRPRRRYCVLLCRAANDSTPLSIAFLTAVGSYPANSCKAMPVRQIGMLFVHSPPPSAFCRWQIYRYIFLRLAWLALIKIACINARCQASSAKLSVDTLSQNIRNHPASLRIIPSHQSDLLPSAVKQDTGIFVYISGASLPSSARRGLQVFIISVIQSADTLQSGAPSHHTPLTAHRTISWLRYVRTASPGRLQKVCSSRGWRSSQLPPASDS